MTLPRNPLHRFFSRPLAARHSHGGPTEQSPAVRTLRWLARQDNILAFGTILSGMLVGIGAESCVSVVTNGTNPVSLAAGTLAAGIAGYKTLEAGMKLRRGPGR